MIVTRKIVPAWLVVLALLAAVVAAPVPAAAQLSDADVYVAEATLAIEDKQWDKALDLLREALTREPDHVEAMYYTGVAYMGKKQPAEAAKILERAREKSPTEPSIAYQLGLAYFALEQYDRARPILEQAFSRDPALDSLGYYVGYLRYRRDLYQEALKAFRVGRTSDPTIADLTKLYSGLALQRLGLPAQAEAELGQIGQLQAASPLTGPAERLKSSIASARESSRRFRAELKLGGFFDDNAAAEPNQKAHDTAVQLARQNNRRTFGELYSLGVEYDWLKQEAWTGTAGFSFFGTHNETLPSFDIQDFAGTLKIARRLSLLDMPAQTGVNYSYDYLDLGYKGLVQRHSVNTYLALVESSQHLTNFQARLEVKEYSEVRPLPTEEFQDAVNYMFGIVHFVRFNQDRHFIKGGYQYDYDNTRGSDFTYQGHRFILGGQYTLPWQGVRLNYDFDLHYRDYNHAHAFLPLDAPGSRERNDKEYTNTVRAEVPLPWFVKDQSFFVTGEFTNKIADSNINSFSYHRNYAAIYFTWQY